MSGSSVGGLGDSFEFKFKSLILRVEERKTKIV